jgi:hypothetical protein
MGMLNCTPAMMDPSVVGSGSGGGNGRSALQYSQTSGNEFLYQILLVFYFNFSY